jgi:membrane protein required for colicin V production
MQGIHWLDIATICVLVVSFIYSLTKGLVRELFSFGSVILAALLAVRFCGLGHSFLGRYLDAPNLNNIIGFITIFVVVTYLGSLSGRIVSKYLKSAGISPTDRFWGGVLGLIKGGILISLTLLLIILFVDQGPEMISQTKVAKFFNHVTYQLSNLLPSSLKKRFDKRMTKTDFKPSPLEKAALEKDKKKVEEIIKDNL